MIDLKLALDIARRFLKSSKSQTLLIILGIAIGVSVQVFIGSLIDGLQVSLVDKTIGSSSHITISQEEDKEYITDYVELVEDLEEDNRFTAVSKSFDSPGYIKSQEESSSVLMRGFEFEAANDIYSFGEKLIEGSLPSSDNEVIIGKNLAESLGLGISDKIVYTTFDMKEADIKIVGIFDLRVSSLNKSWIVTELTTAQKIYNQEDKITSIETQVREVFDADIIADSLKDDLDKLNLISANWKVENEELLSGLAGQSASSIMIQVFVLLAVLLGIASVLAISVVQKSKQLGILKAMGIKDKIASQIFLFQGLILGTIGGIIGAFLGVGLSFGFSNFVKNPDGSALVPFYLDMEFIVISVIIAIIASTLAALIPAINSSKLNPIEVIKNG